MESKKYLNTTNLIHLLCLFFCLQSFTACKVKETNAAKETSIKVNSIKMTALQILPEQKDVNFRQVIFTPSQRIYKIDKDANPKFLELLNESIKNNLPINITFDAAQSDLITNVERIN